MVEVYMNFSKGFIMSVVYAAITPHGDEIIPELNPNMDEKSKKLMDAMISYAEKLYVKNPDLIVLATPHNLRIHRHIGIIHTEFLNGDLESDTAKIEMELKTDRTFAEILYKESLKQRLPVVLVDYGASEGPASSMCLDWGTIIPLWFVEKEYRKNNKELPPVVVITPSREIPLKNLVKLGELIAKLSEKLNLKIAYIASADQGHAHDPDGPYGFDKASEEYDSLIQTFIRENRLEELLKFSNDFIEHAKPDSLWQMLILHGILKQVKLKNTLLEYQCPTYFGMLVATYE